MSRGRYPRFGIYVTKDGHVSIMDEDFGYDVKLDMDGDFASLDHKLEYAQAVIAALNAAEIPTPKTTKVSNDVFDDKYEGRFP